METSYPHYPQLFPQRINDKTPANIGVCRGFLSKILRIEKDSVKKKRFTEHLFKKNFCGKDTGMGSSFCGGQTASVDNQRQVFLHLPVQLQLFPFPSFGKIADSKFPDGMALMEGTWQQVIDPV